MVTHVLESMNEVITNNYDNEHKAIDIVDKNHNETNIIALDSGTVQTVVNNVKSTNHKSKGIATYGNFVKVKQNNGKTALYAHMKYGSIKVNKGETIEKGDIIGSIGNTGNAYGKHLHLEIQNEKNNKENPLISLNENIPNTTNKTNIKKTVKNTDNQITSNIQNTQNPTQNLKTKQEYLNASNYRYGSIVDALKSINIDSSYNYRKKLAKHNGIQNYHGSYSQNLQMLNLLKNGKLKKA